MPKSFFKLVRDIYKNQNETHGYLTAARPTALLPFSQCLASTLTNLSLTIVWWSLRASSHMRTMLTEFELNSILYYKSLFLSDESGCFILYYEVLFYVRR